MYVYSIHTCMYVNMYICIHVCIHVCMCMFGGEGEVKD